jgi:hypothetical protein
MGRPTSTTLELEFVPDWRSEMVDERAKMRVVPPRSSTRLRLRA